MLKGALSISKRTFPRVDVWVHQVEKALGMAVSGKELRIACLDCPWEGKPRGRVPLGGEVGSGKASSSIDVLGFDPSLPLLEGRVFQDHAVEPVRHHLRWATGAAALG